MNFTSFTDFVNQINTDLGPFCNQFQYKRIELNGNSKVAVRNALFAVPKNGRTWSINSGGGTELQYHITVDNETENIRYGLGFNTQYVPHANEMTMVDYMRPFMESYLSLDNELKVDFPSYSLFYGTYDDLLNPKENQYVLWGNEVPFIPHSQNHNEIDDSDYVVILTDLKKQLSAYVKIFSRRNDFLKMGEGIQDFIKILKYKHQLILQGPPGTGKTYNAKAIARQLTTRNSITEADIRKYLTPSLVIESSYDKAKYTIDSLTAKGVRVTIPSGNTHEPPFNEIIQSFESRIWETGGIKNGTQSYSAAIAKFIDKKLSESQVKLIQFHPAYAYEDFVRGITVEAIDKNVTYETVNKVLAKFALNAAENPTENYVLIIDEINRANLPAVLGELIYALEYRGEVVESMYGIGDDNKLVLPENLFIIGTMNTADRSVGHIDYAIRRRFAFESVLPNKKVVHSEAAGLFEKVSKLFVSNYGSMNWDKPIPERSEYMAQDFNPEDVWLGHSYFIPKKPKDDADARAKLQLSLDYEIKPLLREYVKDGILREDVKLDGATNTMEYINKKLSL